ncbi:Flagellar biosynthetic protein FlhB [Sphingomonas antarctica]|uniref:EscU/YscU/HrcU family type III secretion system export apparatus switch protein n=1 Tax=Sphingomonas antarctica TaxID=2040274 RepID=UPI0039ED5C1B
MSDKPDRDSQTEAPSAKRKADAARDGDVLQSRDLGTALIMAACAGWIAVGGGWTMGHLQDVLRAGLSFSAADITDFAPGGRALAVTSNAIAPLFALFGATILAAVAAPAMLGSLGFRPGAFSVKPGKLNPLAGLSRMFGMQGLTELWKSVLKVTLLAASAWWALNGQLDTMLGLARLDPATAAALAGGTLIRLIEALTLALMVIGGIDAVVQYRQRQARLRMTKEQVKQEHKEAEGSPEAKGMQKQRRQELLNGSARRAVTEANVILTNPTHFAVALRYRPGKDAAPSVVARGRGETAQAIKALAKEANVPLLEYPLLARAIYFTTRAGRVIPADLYLAVATILAFVFNLDKAQSEGRAQPLVAVPEGKRFDERGRPEA